MATLHIPLRIQHPCLRHGNLLQNITTTSVINQHRLVRDASAYFHEPSLVVSEPKVRKFFLLPKLHKPISSWRVPFLHPKSRPVISDSVSSSFKLSKKLLGYAQRGGWKPHQHGHQFFTISDSAF
jgi:hypothetical protein